MKLKAIFILMLMIFSMLSCTCKSTVSSSVPHQKTSIALASSSPEYNLNEATRGIIKFTAFIKNEDMTTIIIAHPSICFQSSYKSWDIRHSKDFNGKSEILLKISRPDGTNVVLRDGILYGFEPDNVRFLAIPAGQTRTFDIGWFFENAKGRWENNHEAEKVFLSKGKYTIRILFRNFFPKAAFNFKESKLANVWTGEMESAPITVEIK